MGASEAERKAFGAALGQRVTTKEAREALASALDMSAESIRLYINGEREPERETVFRIERELGEQPGTLSRLLGYLPLDAVPATTVPEAIDTEPHLSPWARSAVLDLYRNLRGH